MFILYPQPPAAAATVAIAPARIRGPVVDSGESENDGPMFLTGGGYVADTVGDSGRQARADPPPAGDAVRPSRIRDSAAAAGGAATADDGAGAQQARPAAYQRPATGTGAVQPRTFVRALPAEDQRLVQIVDAIARTKARESTLPIQAITLVPREDVEEHWSSVVVQVDVRGRPAQAFALWDSIGRAIDDWQRLLPPATAQRLAEHVSVSVTWPADEE